MYDDDISDTISVVSLLSRGRGWQEVLELQAQFALASGLCLVAYVFVLVSRSLAPDALPELPESRVSVVVRGGERVLRLRHCSGASCDVSEVGARVTRYVTAQGDDALAGGGCVAPFFSVDASDDAEGGARRRAWDVDRAATTVLSDGACSAGFQLRLDGGLRVAATVHLDWRALTMSLRVINAAAPSTGLEHRPQVGVNTRAPAAQGLARIFVQGLETATYYDALAPEEDAVKRGGDDGVSFAAAPLDRTYYGSTRRDRPVVVRGVSSKAALKLASLAHVDGGRAVYPDVTLAAAPGDAAVLVQAALLTDDRPPLRPGGALVFTHVVESIGRFCELPPREVPADVGDDGGAAPAAGDGGGAADAAAPAVEDAAADDAAAPAADAAAPAADDAAAPAADDAAPDEVPCLESATSPGSTARRPPARHDME